MLFCVTMGIPVAQNTLEHSTIHISCDPAGCDVYNNVIDAIIIKRCRNLDILSRIVVEVISVQYLII